MIFRKFFLLSREQRKALKEIERTAYFNKLKILSKEKGENRAEKDLKK